MPIYALDNADIVREAMLRQTGGFFSGYPDM